MKAIAIGGLALLSACAGSGADHGTNEVRGAAPARGAPPTAANAVNLAVASDCPEDDLSCGRQRPVVSDGARPFEDANHYLTVTFPRGSQVCLTRSGPAPHGFFAIYGTPPDCGERPERPPRFISVYGEYNALFWTELGEARTEDCRPPSAATGRRLGSEPLQLTGFPSGVCERPSAPGTVELSVYALAGPWQTQGDPPNLYRYRAGLYYLTLGTTDAHFDEDLARFRRVLASVRIATRT